MVLICVLSIDQMIKQLNRTVWIGTGAIDFFFSSAENWNSTAVLGHANVIIQQSLQRLAIMKEHSLQVQMF